MRSLQRRRLPLEFSKEPGADPETPYYDEYCELEKPRYGRFLISQYVVGDYAEDINAHNVKNNPRANSEQKPLPAHHASFLHLFLVYDSLLSQ